jgi:7,8-dihydroneopterin aldolase/epimerase/oxygenase
VSHFPPSNSYASAEHGTRHVFVRDLEIVASVGVYEQEKRYQQRVIISVDLAVRDDYNGTSDRLADVVDYSKIVSRIEQLVEADHVQLLETLAEHIAKACLEDLRVRCARVRIEKPDIIPSVKSVGIEIERRQAQTN